MTQKFISDDNSDDSKESTSDETDSGLCWTLDKLNDHIARAIGEKTEDEQFTIKQLFSDDEWKLMSRSEKNTAAHVLCGIVAKNDSIIIL